LESQQNNEDDKYKRDRQRNLFNINAKSNMSKVNIINNELSEENQADYSNLQGNFFIALVKSFLSLEHSEFNKINLNKRRPDDFKQNKLNNNSSNNVNNYSNLNLVTEYSQKNFEINNNKKFNIKNYKDLELEDSLA